MKRYLISTVVIFTALAVTWPTLGQREGGEGREGQRRFQGLSEEEREKVRAQMRERFGDRGPMFGREEQLKMIEAIEEQLAKLK